MQVINLISDVQLAERKREQKNRLALLGFFAVVGILVFAILSLLGYQIVQKGARDDLKRKIAAKKTEVEDINRFGVEVTNPRTGVKTIVHVEAAGKLVQDQLSSINSLLVSRPSWKALLFNVSQLTPAGITFDQVSVGEGFSVTLSGSADDLKSVSQLVNSLKNYHGDLVTLGIQNGVLSKDLKDGSISLSGQKIAQNEDELRARMLANPKDPLKKTIQDELVGKIEKTFAFSNVSLSSVSRQGIGRYGFSVSVTGSELLF